MLRKLDAWTGLILFTFILALSGVFLLRKTRLLPPGPPPKVISGNVHQMPRVSPWTTFTEWSKQYGSSIIHYRFFGRHFIVLNSVETALELLEHRSNTYSDRPVVWMYNELAGRGMSVFTAYRGIMERELRILLDGLLNTPESHAKHLRRNAGAVVLDLAYGWPVTSDDDYFVSLMEEAFALHKQVVQPGRWLVEVMPFLRFVPSWMPGAYFKRFAFSVRERMKAIDQAPLQWTKQQMANGIAKESFTSQHLQSQDGHYVDKNEERMVGWCASALYAGGADTTVSIMQSFIALMMQYPDIQKEAQSEIDSLLGDHRLPNLDDQSSLPYVSALFKEILRYSPAARLGLPHRVIQEDTYNRYKIPKNSTVIANIWALCRDPSVFTDPDVFDPSRFLTRNEMDPRKLAFGFGRRTSVILSITNILACFNILKPVDVNTGVEYCPEISYTTGVTSHPAPFQCRIVPRPRSNVHLFNN
ncbi:cytochrome P450 [Armillaria mellea]|nr:cytochrome P450 [Armillaria mellea]